MNINKLKKNIILLILPLTTFSQTDNIELQKMFNADQGARMEKNIDWSALSKQDKEREKRVYELINFGLIITGNDYYNSAMIFQHGNDTIASEMAVKQMKKAIELNPKINKWLLAAAIDRDLMRKQKPQIYGTQYTMNNGEKWKRYNIDTTKVTDTERKYYTVETLAEQLITERNMNLKSISDFYTKSKSLKKTIEFIKSEYRRGSASEYNTSEGELNSFGYELQNSKKESEALEIFILNTKLYPTGYIAFDSLGENLLLAGRKNEGIKAYKKSLELNPDNENAKKILTQQK